MNRGRGFDLRWMMALSQKEYNKRFFGLICFQYLWVWGKFVDLLENPGLTKMKSLNNGIEILKSYKEWIRA